MSGPVVMRCNVSPTVGIGHLMRCREIARHLGETGHDAHIIGPPESLKQPEDSTLFQSWQPVPERGTSQDDAARVLQACAEASARHVIMDDYRTDPEYQHLLRGAGIRWMQQFDASAPWPFSCDILVNASPFERREQYLQWLEDAAHTQTLFGPAYAVLRPAFNGLKLRPHGRAVRRILVSFGGGDDRGAISNVLTSLAGQIGSDVTLVVVSGPSNPRRDSIAEMIAALPEGAAELHVAPQNLVELMLGCDMCIIGGGTMSYEAAACGLPTLFLGLAGNQQRPCLGWQDLTGASYLGQFEDVSRAQLLKATHKMINDEAARAQMAAKGCAVVDGKGTTRLVDALLERETV